MRTEDGYIINKCLNGDSAAFGLLVDKYKAGVYALAYSKLSNFQDAEDICQEVFIKAYQNLRTLKRTDSFLSWLYAITSNLCKDWHRSNSRRIDDEFIEDQPPQALESPSLRSYEDQKLFEKLHDALESLPETYRLILTLYYLGGMDSPEIARLLGMSPSAVRKQLSRSRDKLREEMIDAVKEALDKKKLKASFTFRIVEQINRMKIFPPPNTNGLPLGLSISIGLILAFMLVGNYLIPVNQYNENLSSSSLSGGIKGKIR
ncbi:MAG: RNA polymerase sigma factor [Candidatus Poribacteria bacterium]